MLEILLMQQEMMLEDSVRWVNAMQEYVEISDFNVPVDFSSDPRSTAGSGDLYSDNGF